MAQVMTTTKKGEPIRRNAHQRTSIGKSANSRPKNKSARRSHKKYRRQG